MTNHKLPLTADQLEARDKLIEELRTLASACGQTAPNRVIPILIEAVLIAGIHPKNQIVGTLMRLGFDNAMVGAIIDAEAESPNGRWYKYRGTIELAPELRP